MVRIMAYCAMWGFVCATTVLAEPSIRQGEINQGDWAVILVRSLNLDQGRELNAVADFTALLAERHIAPAQGWQPDRPLSLDEYVETISSALRFLCSRRQQGQDAEALDRFLSFLEAQVGIDVKELHQALPSEGLLGELNRDLEQYVKNEKERQARERSAAALSRNLDRQGPGGSSAPLLAATGGSVVNSLVGALVVKFNPQHPDYWSIFSNPASPITPNSASGDKAH